MNKGYIYVNGTIVVANEKGEPKIAEYSDNLDEIFVQQNLVETMESELHKITNEKKRIQNKPIYFDLKTTLLLTLSCLLVIFGLPKLIYSGLGDKIVDTIFGLIHRSMHMSLCILPLISITGAGFVIIGNVLKKDRKSKVNGYEIQIQFLTKQLEEEKEKLNQLIASKETKNLLNNMTRNNEKSIIVDDKEQLQALRTALMECYDLGYNEKPHLKAYIKGDLEDMLITKGYTNSGILLAKEYLGEKAKQKVHKK